MAAKKARSVQNGENAAKKPPRKAAKKASRRRVSYVYDLLTIDTVEVGDIVGEVGVLSNAPRTAFVATTGNGTPVLLMTRNVFPI